MCTGRLVVRYTMMTQRNGQFIKECSGEYSMPSLTRRRFISLSGGSTPRDTLVCSASSTSFRSSRAARTMV